jgi:hypothetical protein
MRFWFALLHIYVVRALRSIAYRFPALRSSSASTSPPIIPSCAWVPNPSRSVTVEAEVTGFVQVSVSDGPSFAFTIQSPRIHTMARHRYHGGRVPCASGAITGRPSCRAFSSQLEPEWTESHRSLG